MGRHATGYRRMQRAAAADYKCSPSARRTEMEVVSRLVKSEANVEERRGVLRAEVRQQQTRALAEAMAAAVRVALPEPDRLL